MKAAKFFLGLTLALVLPGQLAAKPSQRERMQVDEVLATPSGQFVVILSTNVEPKRYLPLWVGEAEAVAIRLRLDRTNAPRPMTLDLLEDVLRTSDTALMEIVIDDVRDGIFLGNIQFKRNGRSFRIDARPSDAIGLALGQNVPIFCTREVLELAEIDPNALEEPGADDERSLYERSL